MTKHEYIVKGAKCELARRSFYDFCKVAAPDFYKPNRIYLKNLCEEIQDFLFSDDEILVINAPPRHGKSRTASLACDWLFGKKPDTQVMIGTYNETLSQTFSKQVRDLIATEAFDEKVIVYSDIFPNISIKQGDGAVTMWSINGQYASYLATSPTGTATGFGARVMIIDDLIKSAEEANNANVLQKHWEWFAGTMISRLEENGKIIIIMTRWHTDDLAGRALEHFKDKKLRHINLQAELEDGSMLCSEILSKESYEAKKRTMGADIASANYQQIPINIKGKLYTSFKTYEETPTFEEIKSYCDTADEGADYLCNIIYGTYKHEAYLLDVYYTQAGMEVTEPEVAQRLTEYEVATALIESNNGGRGFARAVESILKTKRNYSTVVRWFHQSKNKKARILTKSNWIMEHMYFPVNWKDKWPEFYDAMNKYQKTGKNLHDDGPDTATGVAEQFETVKLGAVNVRM